MHDPQPPAAPPAAGRYAAWAIVVFVIFGLIAGVSGLCTGAMVLAGVSDGSAENQAIMMAGLMLGGIPFLVSLALIFVARKWGRKKSPPRAPGIFG
jgi:hypothetical protein